HISIKNPVLLHFIHSHRLRVKVVSGFYNHRLTRYRIKYLSLLRHRKLFRNFFVRKCACEGCISVSSQLTAAHSIEQNLDKGTTTSVLITCIYKRHVLLFSYIDTLPYSTFECDINLSDIVPLQGTISSVRDAV